MAFIKHTYKNRLTYTLLLIIFTALGGSVSFWLRDPQVDLSAYTDVIPSYKLKIKELRTATTLIQQPFYRWRQKEGVKRLEKLAEDTSPIHLAAKKTLYYFYAEPERWQCPQQELPTTKTCATLNTPLTHAHSLKAFYWARQLEGDEKPQALIKLLRDWRVQPLAKEEDRIALIFAAEKTTLTGLKAALALADHHLDKRYFQNNMVGEAMLWLKRADTITKAL